MVVYETEVEMAAKGNLVSSIEREERICDLAVQELKDRCRVFEGKYNL